CGGDINCFHGGTVTVVDGVTLQTTVVLVGPYAANVAVDSTRNKIYVAGSQFFAAIDGASLATTFGTLNFQATGMALNKTTNKVYVISNWAYQSPLAIVDGASLVVTYVGLDNTSAAPVSVAVNETTNKIFVSNGYVTIVDGTTHSLVNVQAGGPSGALLVNS